MFPIIFFSLTLCQYISVINQKIFIQQADSIWEVQKMHSFQGFLLFSETSLQRQRSIRKENLSYGNCFGLYTMKRKDKLMGCLFINWKGIFMWQLKWGLAKSTFKPGFVYCESCLTNQTEVAVSWIIHSAVPMKEQAVNAYSRAPVTP